MNERKDKGGLSAQGRPDGLAEEVAGDHDVHVHGDECSPRRLHPGRRAAIGIGQNLLLDENAANRAAAGLERELLQLADNPANTPAGVLPGQAKDESPQRLRQA
jgi:hypothetical protein